MAARKSTPRRRRARRSPPDCDAKRRAKAIRRLQLAQAVIIAVTGALRHQNADHDADFALALQRGADDPVDIAIELLGGRMTEAATS